MPEFAETVATSGNALCLAPLRAPVLVSREQALNLAIKQIAGKTSCRFLSSVRGTPFVKGSYRSEFVRESSDLRMIAAGYLSESHGLPAYNKKR